MLGRALFLHLAAALLAPAVHNAQVDVAVALPSDGAERLGSQGRTSNPVAPIPEPPEPPEEPVAPGPGSTEDGSPPSDRPNPPSESDAASSPPRSGETEPARPAAAPQERAAAGTPEPSADAARHEYSEEQSSEQPLRPSADRDEALRGVPREGAKLPVSEKPEAGVALALEADGGVSLRLDKEPRGFDTEEPLDMTFGVGGWFFPGHRYALALAYRSMGLGGAKSAAGDEDISVQRDLDTLWLGGRAYPLLGEQLGVFLQLELGGTWQRMAAHGTSQGLPFSCTASEGPALMFGAGAGVDVSLDSSVSFVGVVDGASHRLGHAVVDECAPGSGSVLNVTAQVGFVYRIDLGGEPTG